MVNCAQAIVMMPATNTLRECSSSMLKLVTNVLLCNNVTVMLSINNPLILYGDAKVKLQGRG